MQPVLEPTDNALLHAVNLATKKLAGSSPFDDVLPEVLAICVEAVRAEGGTIYVHNKDARSLMFRHVLPEASQTALQFTDIPDDYGVAGRVFQEKRSIISQFDPQPRDQFATKTGVVVQTMITVPLMMEDSEPIGVVQLINKMGGTFGEADQAVLETVSAVSTMAYLNNQLLSEQTRVSQLLGMGRVAHDIKNMAFALEANLTFSDDTLSAATQHADELKDDLMSMHLDMISEQIEAIKGSTERIKRYTVLMSDLSAGKKPEATLVFLPVGEAIEHAASYLASDGRKRGIDLEYDIQYDAPPMLHDEMYVFRMVQNLVSNAIKAGSESLEDGERGVVCIRYKFANDEHVLEVIDSGPGMSEETASRILNGNARSIWNKSSGSGIGSRIVLELASAHNAVVSIDSELGKGTTFRVTFPNTQAP